MIDVKRVLFFDIETSENSDSFQYIPEPKAPSNYKDAEKIKAYIDEKKSDIINNMSLDPDYGKIITIGYKRGDNPIKILMASNPEEEKKMLIKFQKELDLSDIVCGYNIIGFDIPFIQRRAIDLGFTSYHLFDTSPYRIDKTIDLMKVLYNNNTPKGLKFLSNRYNMMDLIPGAEGITGSMVGNLDYKTIARYCMNDVHKTYSLYNKMNGIYF